MVYALDISGLVPIECLTIRHGKPDLKIGEIKSTSYSTVRVLNCSMLCRIIPYVLVTISCLGSDGYL